LLPSAAPHKKIPDSTGPLVRRWEQAVAVAHGPASRKQPVPPRMHPVADRAWLQRNVQLNTRYVIRCVWLSGQFGEPPVAALAEREWLHLGNQVDELFEVSDHLHPEICNAIIPPEGATPHNVCQQVSDCMDSGDAYIIEVATALPQVQQRDLNVEMELALAGARDKDAAGLMDTGARASPVRVLRGGLARWMR